MYVEPDAAPRMGAAARASAERYAWPNVASQVERVYERAQHSPAPGQLGGAVRAPQGLRADRRVGPVPARAAASARTRARPRPAARAEWPAGSGSAWRRRRARPHRASRRRRSASTRSSRASSAPTSSWVLLATALMMASLFLRAASWLEIARAALPRNRLRRRDVTSATMVGVLMSATLPARVGEPARAMVLARRTGRMRETFPVLLGTLVSQTVAEPRRARAARA